MKVRFKAGIQGFAMNETITGASADEVVVNLRNKVAKKIPKIPFTSKDDKIRDGVSVDGMIGRVLAPNVAGLSAHSGLQCRGAGDACITITGGRLNEQLAPYIGKRRRFQACYHSVVETSVYREKLQELCCF